MAFAVLGFFLYVEYERASRLKNAQEFGRAKRKPIDILFGFDSPVCMFAAVRIRRRSNDQIEKVVRIATQFIDAIALDNIGFNGHRDDITFPFRAAAIAAPACR